MQGARCLIWGRKLPMGTADAPRRRLGNSIYHFAGHEAARVYPQGDAELKKLVYAHLALPIENVPKPFLVDGGPASKFGDTHALQRSSSFYARYWR